LEFTIPPLDAAVFFGEKFIFTLLDIELEGLGVGMPLNEFCRLDC